MAVIKIVICVIAGYLLGSVNSSIFLSKIMGSDVRSSGSGNAGATNMARKFGLKAGLLAMILDMLKAVCAFFIGQWLAGDWGLMAALMACLVGHCFPAFHHFKGGKGVSVGGILSLLVDWRVGLCVIGCFLIGAFSTKKVSVGSMIGGAVCAISAVIFHLTLPRMLVCIFAGCIVIIQHHANIKRLIDGTEPDFKPKKEK